jgi:hypothetical protein
VAANGEGDSGPGFCVSRGPAFDVQATLTTRTRIDASAAVPTVVGILVMATQTRPMRWTKRAGRLLADFVLIRSLEPPFSGLALIENPPSMARLRVALLSRSDHIECLHEPRLANLHP